MACLIPNLLQYMVCLISNLLEYMACLIPNLLQYKACLIRNLRLLPRGSSLPFAQRIVIVLYCSLIPIELPCILDPFPFC